ncbi:hypothetical protein BS47DRAFT_534570 [Hydnum rufescens UP504]|uniref:Uncharacterized protein n=1 Tax=Hydnum rufescens UP504 TaxID=1448309 RepID=A0A9P6AGV0_9AGAM|nr:hypothetical protein BS47DRAFT_534570 [Hydnum rufescens UP504]
MELLPKAAVRHLTMVLRIAGWLAKERPGNKIVRLYSRICFRYGPAPVGVWPPQRFISLCITLGSRRLYWLPLKLGISSTLPIRGTGRTCLQDAQGAIRESGAVLSTLLLLSLKRTLQSTGPSLTSIKWSCLPDYMRLYQRTSETSRVWERGPLFLSHFTWPL